MRIQHKLKLQLEVQQDATTPSPTPMSIVASCSIRIIIQLLTLSLIRRVAKEGGEAVAAGGGGEEEERQGRFSLTDCFLRAYFTYSFNVSRCVFLIVALGYKSRIEASTVECVYCVCAVCVCV